MWMYDEIDATTNMIVINSNEYCSVKIFHLTTWSVIRLIWIGFYKNQDNDKCLIDTLPKDIVNCVITFLNFPRASRSDLMI